MTQNYFCFEYIHESCKLNFDFTSGDSEIPLKYPKTNIFCHVMNSAINQLFKMNSFHIDLIIPFLSFSIQGLDLIVIYINLYSPDKYVVLPLSDCPCAS